jgi:hypothetical protein
MKYAFSIFGFTLVMAASASATEFSQCNSVYSQYPGMTGTVQPVIGANGKLSFDQKALEAAKGSSTTSEDGNTDTMKIPFAFAGGTKNLPSTSYVLTRKDERPESLVQSTDMSDFKMPKGFPKAKDPQVGFVTHFDYHNEHCYVSQTGILFKSGKERVMYDHEACNGILAAVKKVGADKLHACSSALGEMQAALAKAQQRIDGPKREFALGNLASPMGMGMGAFIGVPDGASDRGKNTGFEYLNPFMAAGTCAMTRRQYGMELDPESDLNKGYGIGGTPPPALNPVRMGGEDSTTTPAP